MGLLSLVHDVDHVVGRIAQHLQCLMEAQGTGSARTVVSLALRVKLRPFTCCSWRR
jgi:hypothetical protein